MDQSLPPADAPSSPTQALLKRLRARGLSQNEIARRTHIPQPRLSRWEGGEVAAGADDVWKLQELEQLLDASEPAQQPGAAEGQRA